MKIPAWLMFTAFSVVGFGLNAAFIEIPEKFYHPGFPTTLGYVVWSATMVACAMIAMQHHHPYCFAISHCYGCTRASASARAGSPSRLLRCDNGICCHTASFTGRIIWPVRAWMGMACLVHRRDAHVGNARLAYKAVGILTD